MVIAEKLGLTSQIKGAVKSLKGVLIGIFGPLALVGLRGVEKAALALAETAKHVRNTLELRDESGEEIVTTTAKSSGEMWSKSDKDLNELLR